MTQEIWASFVLRRRFDHIKRDFKMGPRGFCLGLATFLLVVFAFVFVAGTFPADRPLWLTLIYNVSGVVIFIGLAVWWYQRYISRLKISDPEAAAQELEPGAEVILRGGDPEPANIPLEQKEP